MSRPDDPLKINTHRITEDGRKVLVSQTDIDVIEYLGNNYVKIKDLIAGLQARPPGTMLDPDYMERGLQRLDEHKVETVLL